jgi:PilZ domain
MTQPPHHLFADNRRASRLTVNLVVQLARLSSNEDLLGLSADPSRSGISIYLPQELCVGDRLRLCFSVANCPEVLSVEAIVKNRRCYRYGLGLCLIKSAHIDCSAFFIWLRCCNHVDCIGELLARFAFAYTLAQNRCHGASQRRSPRPRSP